MAADQHSTEALQLVNELRLTLNDCPPSYRILMHKAADIIDALQSASAPQPSSATPMVALRRLHEVVGQLLVERDLPWEHKEWDELPQAEKVAMAEAIRRVFFVPSETPAGGTAKVLDGIVLLPLRKEQLQAALRALGQIGIALPSRDGNEEKAR